MADIIISMEFIETPTFSRMVTDLLSDDDYGEMQNELLEDPERGILIKGGGRNNNEKSRHSGRKPWTGFEPV